MSGVASVCFGPNGTFAASFSRPGDHRLWHGKVSDPQEMYRHIGRLAGDISQPFNWDDAALLTAVIRAHLSGFSVTGGEQAA